MRSPRVVFSFVIVGVLVVGGCHDDKAAKSDVTASSTTSATTGSTVAGGATQTTVAEPCSLGPQAPPTATFAADYATALAFAPDGRLFFAERQGTVKVFQDGAVKEFAKVPTVTSEPGGGYSERGLLGLAISPTFGTDHFVYAFVSNPDRSHQDIVRWTDCAGTGGATATLVRLPAGNDCCHKGGRLDFGPDGKLYASLGEEHEAAAAQNTKDPRGKILRYNPDGSVPADNPFGAGNPVWAYGFRNPFGLAISPSGQVAVTSNGPPPVSTSSSTRWPPAPATSGRTATATAIPCRARRGAAGRGRSSRPGAAKPPPWCRPARPSSTAPGRPGWPGTSSSAPSIPGC
ncbi:MAG: PQQ-dependent sugar dehydrogenase [Actinobacteria bacterium]|nr:PQQ-dependent sugar dehydrogenase [Actinomycetota bacterium]